MNLPANTPRNILAALLLLPLANRLAAQPLPEFDFTRAETAREWSHPHHISALQATPSGLEITINGNDPYFFSPASDYLPDTPLWLLVRLKSDQAGTGEVFYFRDRVEPERSVRFSVPAGRWTETRVALPALGANYRLWIDPTRHVGATSKLLTIAKLRRLLGEVTFTPLSSGLRETIAWMQSRLEA